MQFSFDKEIVVDIFKNILWSLKQIGKRLAQIKTSEDFIKDDEGLEKLDSICMQLTNIGEALKQIDKITDSKLLENYGGIDWKRAKGMRDIIIHHYFDIDSEIVFSVCSEHLPKIEAVICCMMKDLEEER
jgi:uncharacterized protein with HEPN domain